MAARSLAVALLAVLAFCARAQEGELSPPFVRTPSDVAMAMLRLAGTDSSDLVVDLGSGDGRIVIAAARELGARGLGIELDPELVERSRNNALAAGVADRVRFVRGDVLLADFSQASVVTLYLLPQLIQKLQPRLLDELQPGARIVSHAFAMGSWKPDRVQTLRVAAAHPEQGDESRIFLWIVPAKARGEWRGGAWRLRVQQNFQEIDLEAWLDGRPLKVRGASLSGREIRWRAGDATFRGRVEGSRMAGELSKDGRSTPTVLVRTD